ncbi:endonuclease [Seonamhaeicola maritimus]|uniref:Tandem-95 repeat protein n=1 Tax=Seonamhaeicola maritimus TaxID=2591822 RepID=A0A5C7GH57_9FLAO|nr:endonuclease [Seonamhaeicola maritimus]TXG36918.1 tandem-95 repeat protein [Seonamhaeicola maritimus]
MKKTILFFTVVLIFSCSSGGGDDSPTPEPDPTPNGKSVAVNDSFTTIEDTAVIIQNILNNDTVLDNARITSFDTSSTEGGTIEDNRDGTYTYTPKDSFIGSDTFTYTICDKDTPPDCSTATVTVTVNDEGSPTAEDDAVNVAENSTRIISNLLENDSVIDDAVLTSVDDTGTQGTVVLNTDGTVSYTAKAGFIGSDSFTYTICDDDTPTSTCSTATVNITVLSSISYNIPSELEAYYSGVIFTNDSDLMLEELEDLTQSKHTTILAYAQRHQYLYNADEDLSNADNVILMYSGESRYWEEYDSPTNSHTPQTFNTEHVYPQSLLEASNAITDLHHLRACDANVNSERSNYPFVDGSGVYKLTGETWFPGNDWRGDVARMIMYLNIRYGETFEKVGNIDLFIAWNIADPVSDFEIQRNNVIYAAQGNRNPFIDNPYLATLVWGGNDAENKWD